MRILIMLRRLRSQSMFCVQLGVIVIVSYDFTNKFKSVGPVSTCSSLLVEIFLLMSCVL